MYEPISVEIDRGYGNGTYRSQYINFTGRLVQLVKKGPTTMRLYEWVDRGHLVYLVHVEEAAQASPPRHSLWEENGLIFASEIGKPLDRRSIIKYQFKKLLKCAGLPHIRFHDLRHTCATLLLGRNVNPKIVSEMLGHASIAITLDTYSHVLPNMQNEAGKALEDALR